MVLSALTVMVWMVALALVGVVGWYQYSHQGHIFRGVSVRGVDLSGTSVAEAEERLRVAFEPYPLMPITVRLGEESWTLTAEDLGVDFDARQAAETAYRVGRATLSEDQIRQTGPAAWLARAALLQRNLQQQLDAFRYGHEVLALETVDRSAGLAWLQDLAMDVYRPVVEAQLRVDGLLVTSSPSQTGRALDVGAAFQDIYQALLANEGGTVSLEVQQTEPLLADVSQAEVFVRQVYNGPITLEAPEPDLDTGAPPPSFTLSAEQLASLVSLETVPQVDGSLALMANLDIQPLRSIVQQWAADLAREPRDARLDFDPDSGEINVVSPSQIGRRLDVDATLAAIRQAALSPTRRAELPLQLIEPAVNMHRTDEMGIVELVSQATTNFKGSSEDRVHNIATGAAAVNGIVVPPGGVFSFNDTIGDVDAEHGYKDSLIIWGDRTAVGIGGGICQVSTTAFRAAYFGGLPIEERWNHGYVVGWYGEPGLDATIYTPDVDLKFRNSTDHHLLIETAVDEIKGTLTFYFYGTKPDWQVEVIGPETLEETPAPAPIYQEDNTLAPGVVEQVEFAKKGQEVEWRRIITDGAGQVLADELLQSSYTPWPAYYLVGPGAQVPDGVEVRPPVETALGQQGN